MKLYKVFFTVFFIVFYSEFSLSCPTFKFKKLQCKNLITGTNTNIKLFQLKNRPDYQVLVSHVGSRFRTLILPFESTDRFNKFSVLYCDQDKLKTEQYFENYYAESFFYVNHDDSTVIQKGQVLDLSDDSVVKRNIHIKCQVKQN